MVTHDNHGLEPSLYVKPGRDCHSRHGTRGQEWIERSLHHWMSKLGRTVFTNGGLTQGEGHCPDKIYQTNFNRKKKEDDGGQANSAQAAATLGESP